jgi:hypothetical protein
LAFACLFFPGFWLLFFFFLSGYGLGIEYGSGMEGQEEEVGDHVEEATAAAAAETPACSQAKRKSPWLLAAPMVSKPAKTKRGKSGSAREERLKEPQALIKRSSPVWTISSRGFNMYVDPKLSKYTICNECIHEGNAKRAEFLCGVDRPPTNARHHLQSHHPAIYDSLLQQNALKKQVRPCSESFTVLN